MVHDVFISFKNSDENGRQTKDSEIAKKLYEFLTKKGLRVFFSNIELEFTGKSQYSKIINEALDSSRFLVAVGSSYKNLNSEWVNYEWDSFLNDIRTGWRVPTHEEQLKLLDTNNVFSEWIDKNGLTGRKFTDKATGNSIFLPAVGCRNSSTLDGVGHGCYYWSSTQYDISSAGYMFFGNGGSGSNWCSRSNGFSVRSVAE